MSPLSSTCQNEHLDFSVVYEVEERKEGLKNEFLSSRSQPDRQLCRLLCYVVQAHVAIPVSVIPFQPLRFSALFLVEFKSGKPLISLLLPTGGIHVGVL